MVMTLSSDDGGVCFYLSRLKTMETFRELLQMFGLFQILQMAGRSQLQRAIHHRRRQRRITIRKAAYFAAAVITATPRRAIWVRPRSQHWWDTVVLRTFTDDQWRAHFRMRRATFDVLCGKLRPHLDTKQTHLRDCVPLEKRVAVAVWYLATGASCSTLSDLFGIGKATVHNCVWEVCFALRTLQGHFVSLPRGEKQQEIVVGFEERWGFPQCCGAVGVSHIPVSPPSSNASDYSNCKGSYSIILQAVVDHLSRFININVGWAGSAHDATVLRNSTLFELAESGELFPPDTRTIESTQVPLMLLGDPAYPLLSWLMTGYPDDGRLTAEQRLFNCRLSRARATVGSAFGQLKGRWRCLLKRVDVDISKAPTIVSCCCVLHNLCAQNGDDFMDAWLKDVEELVSVSECDVPTDDEQEQPAAVRQALVEYFSRKND